MSYDLNKVGFNRRYSNPTSAYDLNEVGGFGKRKYTPKRKGIEERVKKINFSPYDLNQVGGFKKRK